MTAIRSKAARVRLLLCASVVAIIAGAASPARARAAPPQRKTSTLFALVIGYNLSDRKDQQPLRYADDDAALNAQLMRQLGARVALLTELDAQTRKLHPALATAPPTNAALTSALAQLDDQIRAANARGEHTELYIFYTGHGDVERGEGYVQLRSGRLYRSKLLAHLARVSAKRTHVIIDACKSYFLVFDRGGSRRRRTLGGFLPADTPLPASTGLILSTSSAQSSHEWEAYQAGVFSHEVRSALRGAADQNSDGVVTYEELAAFVYTANSAVPNRRYRPSFFVRRPRDAKTRASLLDLRSASGRRVVFGPRMARHFFVETRLGVRLADLHPGRGRVTLLVPAAGRLYVREPKARREYIVSGAHRRVVLANLQPRTSTSRARGAEHEAFTHLFASAFDRGAFDAFRTHDQIIEVPLAPSTPLPRWLRPALGVFAAASLVAGLTFSILAVQERGDVNDDTSHLDRTAINQRIRRNNALAITGYALGTAAAAGYLLWTFWPERRVPVRLLASIGPAQGALTVTW
ncbi:MAG: caspase family protein [Myxococcales bacterium]|nr:caspase family protein [Myxococcales bacterium]